jgi:hypothetical protein
MTAPSAGVTEGLTTNSNDYSFNIVKDERRFRRSLPGDVERAATNVRTAFAAVGIPVQTLSRTPRVIGTERFVMRRTFAGKAISAYLDCGNTNSGLLANIYRIQAAILASVQPAGTDSVTVETRLTAQAFSNEGASGGSVDCSSLGVLENRLLDEARVAAAIKQ